MSEDPTRTLPDEKGKTTQPMLETLLEEVRAMRVEHRDLRAEVAEMRAEQHDLRDQVEAMRTEQEGFRAEVAAMRTEQEGFRAEVAAMRAEQSDFREYVEVHLDRVESMTNQTRAEMLTLRADFREFASRSRQPA